MENYSFKPLEPAYFKKAARCLAETFVGVQKSDYVIQEPLVTAIQIKIDEFTDFCHFYLESTYEQGFHFIAIDNETDEVVGVMGTDLFDPTQEEEPFTGDLEMMNHVSECLGRLDAIFVEKFEAIIERKIKKGDLLHGFLIGVQTPKNKRFIAKKLMDLVLEKGKEQKVLGFFVEATNPRSQRLITQEFGAYLPIDLKGEPIQLNYKDDSFFHVVPSEVAEFLQILYVPVNGSYVLN